MSSKSERIEYARRLEKIEALKAKERQATSTGGSNPQLCKKSDEAGRTDEVVEDKLGIGSKDTYRKEKYISDNREVLTPEDFADWDEGKLSTNKAYLKIKTQLQEKENQNRIEYESEEYDMTYAEPNIEARIDFLKDCVDDYIDSIDVENEEDAD